MQLRPDSLEYFQTLDEKITETAAFGELGYQVTEAWQVTVGARWFKFEDEATQGFDEPLAATVFGGRTPQDLIDPTLQSNDVDDDDVKYKFNTSYHFTDDIMGYLTVSEGYRLGGLNPVPPCTGQSEGQNVCALPNEILIKPDTTTNYELGLHSQFGDSVLFNSALYYIDWDDVQVAGVTKNGNEPIIKNGSSASSYGVEMSGQWYITDALYITGSYAYTKAELTDDAPGLVGFDANGEPVDAYDGDRLPGSPEHQGFLAVNYAWSLSGGSQIDFDWSMTAQSDVLTKAGERNFGESLDGFSLHNVSATWFRDSWTVALYADNVFDEYAETGVRDDYGQIRQIGDFDLRRYYHNVVRPRQVGMRFTYRFDQ